MAVIRCLGLAVFVCFLADAVITAAQAKPDFSGEWILNRSASTLSPGADAMQSGVVRIEHREPAFRYDAEFFSASSAGSLPIRTAVGRPRRRLQLRREWSRYELVDGGRRLRAVEELRGRGRDQDNVWIFDRK